MGFRPKWYFCRGSWALWVLLAIITFVMATVGDETRDWVLFAMFIILANLEAIDDRRRRRRSVLANAAKACGTALDDFIRLIDRDEDSGNYSWRRPPRHEEGQAAMAANNALAEALGESEQ